MPITDELHYRFADGDGTPLVFLHGWLGSMQSWNGIREQLDIGNPMLCYDHRCHGQSPCAPFDFDNLTDDLHGLVEEHRLERPVLVGHSMGGMVALTYATRYGAGGLFLSGTCASTPTPVVESPRFFLEQFDAMDREQWAGMIVDNYFPATGYNELRAAAKQELMTANETAVTCGLDAMIGYDVRDRLDAQVPATVVGATQDRAITPDRVQELAALLDVEPVMLDTCHLITEAEPGVYARLLAQFMDSGSGT